MPKQRSEWFEILPLKLVKKEIKSRIQDLLGLLPSICFVAVWPGLLASHRRAAVMLRAVHLPAVEDEQWALLRWMDGRAPMWAVGSTPRAIGSRDVSGGQWPGPAVVAVIGFLLRWFCLLMSCRLVAMRKDDSMLRGPEENMELGKARWHRSLVGQVWTVGSGWVCLDE